MESVGEKGAKIPVFDGKADKYQLTGVNAEFYTLRVRLISR